MMHEMEPTQVQTSRGAGGLLFGGEFVVGISVVGSKIFSVRAPTKASD